MDTRKLLGNFTVAVAAQAVALLVNLLVTLFVPRVLNITQFGYWQLFIFYSSYVGLFHLGLNDGVYLLNGGRPRGEIAKNSVVSQFLVGGIFQTILASMIIIASFVGSTSTEREFVIISTALFMVINNLALYLGYIFQSINETKLFSKSMILDRLIFLIPLITLLVFQERSFQLYVLANLLGAFIRLIYCLWNARDLFHTKLLPIKASIVESFKSIQIGIKLMLANIASMLILGIARFIIDIGWGIETFGKLSLALSMVTFFLSFVTQASMVLFPALRQTNPAGVAKFYGFARDFLGLIFPFIYLLYFPLAWFLRIWLPQYESSLIFFAYLLPICVFDSKMNITATTIFKVRREELILLKINLITVMVSTSGALIGVYIIHSELFIIGAAVVAIAGRSIFSEWYLSQKLAVEHNYINAGEVSLSLLFIVFVTFLPTSRAILSFLIAYIIYLLIFRKQAALLSRNLGKVIHK